MDVVRELNPLALAQVRVRNGLAGLDDISRAAVLAWVAAETLLAAPDPSKARAAFLAEIEIKMAVLAGQPVSLE